MDTFLSVSLSLLVVLGISFYAISHRYKQKEGRKLPLGKRGWPIIGETLEFIMAARNGNPEKFILDRMHKYSPKVFMTSLMGEKVVVFCGASGNKCLFSKDNKFVSPWYPSSIKKVLFSPDSTPRTASRLNKEGRGITNVFLKPEVVQSKFVGIMDCMSKQHIKQKWEPHQQVLAFELAKKYTVSLACRLFFSIEDPKEVARLEDLFQSVASGMLTIPINFPGTPFNRAIKHANIFRKEILPTIKQRRIDLLDHKGSDLATSSSQDILSQILLSTDEVGGEFRSDIDVADLVLGLFVAGHDTTTTVLTYIVNYLAELPHVYTEVLKEQLEIFNNKKPGELLNWEDIQKMKYSWNVANEAMRLAPPAQGTYREAITEFTFDGFTIPKGCKLHWTVHSTNRNPEYFENPEKFDPSRFQGNGPVPYSFAPFGGGSHLCPGREFARIEILVFMHNLVTTFGMEKLIPNEKTLYILGAVPANGLPIRLHPRNGQKN